MRGKIPTHLSVREAQRLLPPQPRKKVKPPPPTPTQRIFTKEFKLHQRVFVIRHEHGWEDGRVSGSIILLAPDFAMVLGNDGFRYEIYHCRDISPC